MEIKEIRAKLMDVALEYYKIYCIERDLNFGDATLYSDFGRYDGMLDTISKITGEKYADLLEEIIVRALKGGDNK